MQDLTDVDFMLSERALLFALTVVGAGLVLGILGEALIGRSVGKVAMGCEVIDVRVTDRPVHPKVWQAATRNVIKWVLSPAAMIGLMDPEGRHRGDSMAGTAVVMPELEEDESDDEPFDE